MDHTQVQTTASVFSVFIAGGGIALARRSPGAKLPSLARMEKSTEAASLPAEIEERIFLAQESGEVEDDIAAREAGIAYLDGRLAQAKTAEERMPIHIREHELRAEIEQLGGRRRHHETPAPANSTPFDPLWAWMYRLTPAGRRTTPWLAAVIGFFFGGIGLALYFRKRDDVIALVVLVILAILLAVATGYPGLWVVIGALCAIYGFLRSESSNEQLAAASAATAG